MQQRLPILLAVQIRVVHNPRRHIQPTKLATHSFNRNLPLALSSTLPFRFAIPHSALRTPHFRYESPLHPRMPPPARIARAPHPQRHALEARVLPQSTEQEQIILLRKICQLIERDVLKLARRIPKFVQRPTQIPKRDRRRHLFIARPKLPRPPAADPPDGILPAEQLVCSLHQPTRQAEPRKVLPNDQRCVPREPHILQCPHQQRNTLATTSRSSIKHLPIITQAQKQVLLLRRLVIQEARVRKRHQLPQIHQLLRLPRHSRHPPRPILNSSHHLSSISLRTFTFHPFHTFQTLQA